MLDKVTAAAVRTAKRWVVPLPGILEMGFDHMVEVGEDLVSEQGFDSHKQNLLGKIDKTIGENTIAAVAVQVADIHHVSWVEGYEAVKFHHIQLSPTVDLLSSSPYSGSEGPKGSSQQPLERNLYPPPFSSSPQPKWALEAMHHHRPWRFEYVKR